MQPCVSVIVPNYNHARFLRRRLDSVFGQTFTDYEVLILDDCSSDGSREVITEYAGRPGVRLIFNEQNSGSVFAQWNRGMNAARGRFAWIAESDDAAEPTFLESLVPRLEADPRVGIAYCQSIQIDQADQVIGPMDAYLAEADPDLWKHDFTMAGSEFVQKYMSLRSCIPNASAVLMRRATYLEVGGADETYRLGGDRLLYTRMLQRCNVAFTTKTLNFFRCHRSTQRSASRWTGDRVLEEYRYLLMLQKEFGLSPQVNEAATRYIFGLWLSLWRQPSSQVPIRRHWEIARLAYETDAGVFFRLLRAAGPTSIARLRYRIGALRRSLLAMGAR